MGISALHGSNGTQLLTRPKWNAETTLDARPFGAVDGSKIISAFTERGFDKFLFLLPDVASLVQERVCLAGYITLMGSLMD